MLTFFIELTIELIVVLDLKVWVLSNMFTNVCMNLIFLFFISEELPNSSSITREKYEDLIRVLKEVTIAQRKKPD